MKVVDKIVKSRDKNLLQITSNREWGLVSRFRYYLSIRDIFARSIMLRKFTTFLVFALIGKCTVEKYSFDLNRCCHVCLSSAVRGTKLPGTYRRWLLHISKIEMECVLGLFIQPSQYISSPLRPHPWQGVGHAQAISSHLYAGSCAAYTNWAVTVPCRFPYSFSWPPPAGFIAVPVKWYLYKISWGCTQSVSISNINFLPRCPSVPFFPIAFNSNLFLKAVKNV